MARLAEFRGYLLGQGLSMCNILRDNTRMKEDDELLIVITPHVVASRNLDTDEIWVSEK
jgi:hypothetical protein